MSIIIWGLTISFFLHSSYALYQICKEKKEKEQKENEKKIMSWMEIYSKETIIK